MGQKEWEPSSVFDLFGDDLARQLLVLASDRPFAADELASALDTSLPTVYRRLNALGEYDLVREEQELDRDGNHYKTYETTLQRIAFEIEDGGYTIDVQLRQSLVSQFGEFWADLGGPPVESGGEDRGDGEEPGEHFHGV